MCAYKLTVIIGCLYMFNYKRKGTLFKNRREYPYIAVIRSLLSIVS